MAKRTSKKEVKLKAEEQSNNQLFVSLNHIVKHSTENYYIFDPKNVIVEASIDKIEPVIIVLWYSEDLALETMAYRIKNEYYIVA